MTVRDLCTNALREINAVGINETPNAPDINTALGKLNRLLDNWNAMRRAVWANASATFTLVPNLSPHTIGPDTATFTVTQRPVNLLAVNIILTTANPPSRQPVDIIDAQTYANAILVPELTSSIPICVYYQPDWPNGSLYFYPVPNAAYDVELWYRVLLSSVVLSDTFSMPPGYEDAVTLSLAEMLVNTFARMMPASLPEEARKARNRIFNNNDVTPILITQDAGIPSGPNVGRRADFNFLTGLVQ